MKRIAGVVAGLVILAVTSVAVAAPNVLFLAADDLRNDLGCYGNREVKTPNIDRLAARGVVFERAYTQQALCNPSRASLMTGRRPDTLRLWNLSKHFRDALPDVVTLPQHFRRHGYFAQNIGKIYHNFRQEIQGDPESWSVPAVLHYGSHWDDAAQTTGPVPENLAQSQFICECRDVPDEAYYDGRVAALAMEALRDRATKPEPFFLAVGFWKPHVPLNAPKRYWDLYRREEVSMPAAPEWPQDAPRIAWHNGREVLRMRAGKDQGQFRDLTPAEVRELRHGYLANISYLDAQIGKVLDELRRLKLEENTIVVLWSDHGFHLGEHTLWAKTSNFELDARVPLIIAAPGIQGGLRTGAVSELLDLYPTLAELAGLPGPEGVEGVSLVPALQDPSASVKEAALTQHPRPAYYTRAPDAMGYSVRTERFRYTEWRDWKTGQPVGRELYDHNADPMETVNRIADPACAADVERCAALLQGFRPVAGSK
ncbi:MAG: sulfatase [Planctomycetota bacterium]